jgi:type 1 glutamine amidotransferase
MRLLTALFVPLALLSVCLGAHGGDAKAALKKIVLLAGDLDKGHPPGTHEYVKSVQILARCLEGVEGVTVETHLHGWPAKEGTLDDAATIVLLSSGADRNPRDHPFLVGDRLKVIERQMKRGCGLVVMHWGLFVPEMNGGEQFLDWIGGYFDYENGPEPSGRSWYSKIRTAVSMSRPGSPRHPVCRGVEPFKLREEYYYNIRFRPDDARRVPLLTAEIPGEKGPQVVAWGVERKDGGRGFGFTGGHFFDNWKVDGFRTLVLNAVLWTARVEVPAGGVQAPFSTNRHAAHAPRGTLSRPSRALPRH